MHELSICLFGSPQISRASQPIILQRRKDLALLVYLAVTAQPHRRDTLAALLWEQQDQEEARSNLRRSLSRLRSILGEKVLLTAQDEVRINPEVLIDLDITEFNLRVGQLHAHRRAQERAEDALCTDCRDALEEAALLYRADFLAGFSVADSAAFEEWHFFQSEGLRKDLAEVLAHLTRLYASGQEYNAAIETCRRWLALDRLHEPAHRGLMTLYALSGQRAAAIRQFEECKRILEEELGAEPEEETVLLFNRLQKRKGHSQSGVTAPLEKRQEIEPVQRTTSSRKRHQFPVHPAPFIGREKEVGEVVRLLRESPYRLITLRGPGGSGKTRLALQVGATQDQDTSEPFRDGIWFVPLTSLTEPGSIFDRIAQTLDLPGHGSRPDARNAFLGEVHGREMLLILDNFEHLLNDASTGLVTDILSASPRTKIVLTSRERLNLESEYVFPVGGLETPAEAALLSPRQGDADFRAFSALRLFEECANRVQPGFKIMEENYRAVVDICNAVRGMPLAIELAASWIELYTPAEIFQEIARSLDFLQSNWRDLPDRQRSLRAVFDSSWSLLDQTSRPVIKALSAFRSSFTREAAQAVSGASPKSLLDLTHKSWIQRLSDGRYQIHELLRQFVFEKLASEPTTFTLVMERYGNYYAARAARLWQDMKGADQPRALAGMEAEFDNIHVAWSWLVSAGKLETAIRDMLPVLFHYAELRAKTHTLILMLDAALASLGSFGSGQDAQGRQQEIILRAARSAFFQDGFPVRYNFPQDVLFPIDTASIRRAWTLAQEQDSFHTLGFWGILLAYMYGRILQYDEGVRQLQQMLPTFEGPRQTWEQGTAYLHLLKLLIPNEQGSAPRRGQLAEYLSQARDIFTSLGDAIHTGHVLSLWGDLEYQGQDLEGAIQQWQLARNSFLDTGEWAAAAHMLWQLSDACLQVGDFQQAFDGYREIAAIYRERGLRIEEVSALSKESYEKARHGDIQEALQIRRRCLDIILETGHTYQFAWNYWEMGELMRVMGDLEAASQWYERADPIFVGEGDNLGRSYYFRGMGDIALARMDYGVARDHFSTSVDLATSANHTWMVCYSLSKLARAQVELGEIASARRNLRSAMQAGMKTLDARIVLVALAEYAQFSSKVGRYRKAVALSSLVSAHFASWHETRAYASAILDSLIEHMEAADYEQSRDNGRSLDLWACVKDAVDEPG